MGHVGQVSILFFTRAEAQTLGAYDSSTYLFTFVFVFYIFVLHLCLQLFHPPPPGGGGEVRRQVRQKCVRVRSRWLGGGERSKWRRVNGIAGGGEG